MTPGVGSRSGAGRAVRGLAGVASLFVLVSAALIGISRVSVETGVESFLPSGNSSEQLEEKAESFGGDPVVVLLTSEAPTQLLLEQDSLSGLLALEGRLAGLPDVASVYGPATVLNQTAGAIQGLLAQITGRRDGLREETRQAALAGGATPRMARRAADRAVAAFDQRYAALLVRGLPSGLPTLRNPKFVANVVFGSDGEPKPSWRFVVPRTDMVTLLVRPREGLDQEAASRLSDRVRDEVADAALPLDDSVVTGVPVLTSSVADRAATELTRLGFAALIAVVVVLLAMPWTAGLVSRLRPVVAAAIGAGVTVGMFGWLDRPLSLGVVAFLPILLGIGSDFPIYLLRPGSRRRIVAAAAAATVAFGSLALSPLPFVRELGLALALGVVTTVAAALLIRRLGRQRSVVDEAAVAPQRPAPPVARGPRVAVLLAGAAVAGLGWLALPGLEVETRVEALAEGLPELQGVATAEEVLGSSGEVSILVSGPDVRRPEVLAWTQRTQDEIAIAHGDELHPVLTPADLLFFLGSEPTAEEVGAAFDILPDYLTTAVVRADGRMAALTYGVDIDDVQRQSALFRDIRATLPELPAGYDAEIVGLPVAAAASVDAVSSARLWVNLVGIAAAIVVLALLLRERRTTLAALLTVLFATGWVVALSALVDGTLSPLTLAVGSLVTATGCEFAVMLSGRRHPRMVVGVATAALAATAGYATLLGSELSVLRDFGATLAVSVAMSFVAALLVTWALKTREAHIPTEAPSTPRSRTLATGGTR